MKNAVNLPTQKIILIILAAAWASLAITPNWSALPAAWIAPALWLYLSRNLKWKIFLPVFIILQTATSIIGNLDVFPFPLAPMILFYFIVTLFMAIPFALDCFTLNRAPEFFQTLIFPSSMVLIQYIISQGPSGTWGNIAYTQTSWLTFIQSVSIGGIWLIDFMIYWFAPITLYSINSQFKRMPYAYILCFILLLIFGQVRQHSSHQESLSIVGVSADALSIGEAILSSEYEKFIEIPRDIAQSDPLLTKLNEGYMSFLNDPGNPTYEPVRTAIRESNDRLFKTASGQVTQSTDLVVYSEGAFQSIKSEENLILARACQWAVEHNVMLFLPMAVFHTGNLKPNAPFIENKIVIIAPNGKVINEYYKNVPVEGIEPSFPGDGTIPQIKINGSHVSPAICYDADFPDLISQTGKIGSNFLILPSSDWYAIAEIHGKMAVVRAIENDITLFRPTANGYTLAVSGRGNILFKASSFNGFSAVQLNEVPAGRGHTLYSKTPEMMIYASLMILLIGLLSAIPKVRKWLSVVWIKAGESSTNN